MDEQKEATVRNFFFDSIKKKSGWSFGILIILLLSMIILTYNLNKEIEKDAIALREVEAPLNVMVEQVKGYDALLTGNARTALLFSLKGDIDGVNAQKKIYDANGIELDHLLNVDALELLEKSERSTELKEYVRGYLSKLDSRNLALVDIETRAFEAMNQNNSQLAYSLLMSSQYESYKNDLYYYYGQWSNAENQVSEFYRLKVITNSKKIRDYNLILGSIFFLIACIIPFFMSAAVVRPIIRLKKAADEIEKGNFKERVEIHTGDELEDLAESINNTAESLENIEHERKQIDKAKTDFLSITSHELRSPMTPMKAQLQMLLEEYYGKLSQKQKESIEVVIRNTDRLDKIIQDFLDISRIEAARLKFTFVKTDLEPVIKSLIEEMTCFMPEKKITLTLKMDKLPEFEVDPDRTIQVLRNLLSNAIKFSKENSRIIITVKLEKNQIIFSVQDFGEGIDKSNQSRIFEPFFQEEQTMYRKYGGTGLGLAISKGIVESQKGRIWFVSDKGKGSTFYFTIPLTPVTEIEPIKVLFSRKSWQEEQAKKLFLEYLGPLGDLEFEALRKKGLSKESIIDYIEEMHKSKILYNIGDFKNKILLLFKEKEARK